MKLFIALTLVALSIAASASIAEARSSTKDFQMPGLNKEYQKKYYRFTCVDGSCGNWNVKS